MPKKQSIELDEIDLGQLLDGLEVRAESWNITADFHRTGTSPPDFVVEECIDADEADKIAVHYRSIIAQMMTQREVQS